MANLKIHDISPLIHSGIAVYPGDTPFSQEYLLKQKTGAHLDLSHIKTTVHVGAHTDSPSHYDPKGRGIDECELDPYLGACQVVEVKIALAEAIQPKDIDLGTVQTPRILFKTGSFPDPNQWTDEFNFLSPELVEELSKKGVKLIGIDTPSIDHAQSKVLKAHHKVAEKDMRILEGIVLNDVAPGRYDLIALPLKISGADASPVRAILLESGSL